MAAKKNASVDRVAPPVVDGGLSAGGVKATAPVTVPAEVAVVLPMLRGRGGYVPRRVDVVFSPKQEVALRDLMDGLAVKGVFAKATPSAGDALRWLLDRAAEGFAAR